LASRFTGNLLGNLVSQRTDLDADDDARRSESRALRNIFVFSVTLLCIGGALGITLLGFDGTTAQRAVEGLLGLVELTIIFFLSTVTIDRSEVLTNIGKGVRARAEHSPVIIQTPDEAMSQYSGNNHNRNGDDSVG
jgi:hypothetical protein